MSFANFARNSLNPHKKPQYYHSREHLKHPIPIPMEIIAIGKTLTENEWHNFCKRNIDTKALLNCTRNHNGTLSFIGGGSLDGLIKFQHKFGKRFHLKIICANKYTADLGLTIAKAKNLTLNEIQYKNDQGETITIQIFH